MRATSFLKIIVAVALGFCLAAIPAVAFAGNHPSSRRSGCPSVKVGHASWYSKDDPGVRLHTANREIFDDTDLTCAMWGVPFNQRVRITNLANGKSVVVRVNDRGPHKRFVKKGRIIDLTKHAFTQIASLKHGLIRIQVELL